MYLIFGVNFMFYFIIYTKGNYCFVKLLFQGCVCVLWEQMYFLLFWSEEFMKYWPVVQEEEDLTQ